ncbi:hypothetical protein AVEN_85749-1 [Araneus ventricosus]|uniref:Uncharacterized protein n=1 Tax=Araneus ventricosus TaxID=182803 RepID=A0A4Y2BEM2_ARAVE|nr:hypothetical protein AVEN_85749-1 [Araneus ventricosus]
MLRRSIKRLPNSQRHRCSRIANFTIPPSRSCATTKRISAKLTHRSGVRTSRPLTREEPKSKKAESISCNPLSTVGQIYVIATTALDRYWSRDQYR